MIFPSFNISVKMIFSIAYFDEQPIETPFLLISIINNWGKGGGEKIGLQCFHQAGSSLPFSINFLKRRKRFWYFD